MKNKIIYGLVFASIWLMFQCAYIVGVTYQTSANNRLFLAKIENRIAIDLPKLRLANPKFKTVADARSVVSYINTLNSALESDSSPVWVTSIQGISIQPAPESNLFTSLQTSDQEIAIGYQIKSLQLLDFISAIPVLLALIMSFLCIRKLLAAKENEKGLIEGAEQPASHQLTIDLKSKSLCYSDSPECVALSNKPFCFYAALIDFCMQDSTANLSNSSDVPEELIQLANKYFYRLIELGHTKRKRPDFGANLDKTLSEIRSALDEIFVEHQEEKELFYPPKAQGEGSRSKLHNYALPNIAPNKIVFIGK
ncbi:hypothetical protein FX988_02042 [Paraglaciecola mesophila]|uniref:Uncharacterized protein n=1 Tax=Paraglaciecola mesophila TaxID=197222 RepID=A0A857JJP6_9ALTE|nr:hypothetical protein [Paraglaciecola mesophila]QHJ11806.1 hypothetical protein FX988_02042 [Paraglaciecola mesophila]